MQNCTFFQSISIFQRTLFGLGYAERCVQRSCVVCPQADVSCTCGALDVAEPRWLQSLPPTPFRREGEFFYVIAQRAVVTMLYSACMPRVRPTADTRRTNAEMHPMTQASSGTPHTKQMAGARGTVAKAWGVHSPSAVTRITFGVMDIDRRAIPYLSYAYPMLIL